MSQQAKEQAQNIFTEFLETKKHRKTPERFAILEEVYDRSDHFDVEMLFNEIIRKGHHVSRATVYNTLDLLLECDLVVKHQFGKGVALYEKSLGFKQHDHVICLDTKEVLEFCDPRIQQIQSSIESIFNLDIHSHSLTFYGTRKSNK